MSLALMNTYGTRTLTFVRGEGSWLIADDGKRYLDAISGIAVCGLGHAHPAIAQAIAQQAATLVHTSNLYNIPQQQKLGTTLCALAGMEKVFFGNSGAEANECAIKLPRLYGRIRRQQRDFAPFEPETCKDHLRDLMHGGFVVNQKYFPVACAHLWVLRSGLASIRPMSGPWRTILGNSI